MDEIGVGHQGVCRPAPESGQLLLYCIGARTSEQSGIVLGGGVSLFGDARNVQCLSQLSLKNTGTAMNNDVNRLRYGPESHISPCLSARR
jgi:hypothetical protein